MCPWSMDLLPDRAVAETMGVFRAGAHAQTRVASSRFTLCTSPFLVALLKVFIAPCGNICLKVHIYASELLITVHSPPDNYSSLICTLNEA